MKEEEINLFSEVHNFFSILFHFLSLVKLNLYATQNFVISPSLFHEIPIEFRILFLHILKIYINKSLLSSEWMGKFNKRKCIFPYQVFPRNGTQHKKSSARREENWQKRIAKDELFQLNSFAFFFIFLSSLIFRHLIIEHINIFT